MAQAKHLGLLISSAAATITLAAPGWSQTFTSANSQIPASAGFTENIDFSDIDHDGDRDAVKADGGDTGNEQNHLWVNRGFEPGGTIGFFVDRTVTQFPSVLDDSRDMDFVDIDLDGDDDLYVSNTSTIAQQSNRWWINMGGAQGGTLGFFTDQTPVHWTFIAVNNGTTHNSSIAPASALGSGGFVDWSCDCVFGDLDNDGDDDLFHSTYGGVFGGQVPSRVFLNDGTGLFEEYNPSHFQLAGTTIANGNPALWCEGTQQHGTSNTTGTNADIADTPLGVELGDLDGDFDLDVLQGARNETPRIYKNRLTDTGSFAFRDVTFTGGYTASVSGTNNYEQELGDFDNDNDLDLYGLNWPGFNDITMRNNGTGVFSSAFTLSSSGGDDNEPDWFDFNNDGLLDAYCSAFAAQNRLYRNPGGPNFQHLNVTATELPTLFERSLGADTCDIDNDGDYDVLVANDAGDAEHLYKNNITTPDTIVPRIPLVEQAPNRTPGPNPTVVRVHVYDNASWDVTRYDIVSLEYSTNGGGSWTPSPMLFSGGQIFRGTIPGALSGTIDYRIVVTDDHNNSATSVIKSYLSGCGGSVTYCTAGTTSNGCNASMSGSGTPSASAASGFTITASNVEGQKQGLLFYGVNGRHASVWAPGNSSFLCVKAPVQRTGTQTSGGTASACDGTLSIDWNAYMSSHPGALGQPLSSGQLINSQAWFRDPAAPGTTNLSNGLEFSVCP